MPTSSLKETLLPRWGVPIGLVAITLAYSTATEDRFHALRWSLLALAATLGLSLMLLRGSARIAALSLSHARMPLALAGGFTCFSLLSLVPAPNKAEGLWQASQTAAWSAWFLVLIAAGSVHPPLWRILRKLAVASALLAGGFAIGEYWGLWASEAGSPMRPAGLHGNRNLAASFQVLLSPWILWAMIEERGRQRALAGAAWLLGGYLLAIAQSRAAWVGAVVMGLVALTLLLARGRSSLSEVRNRRRIILLSTVLPLFAAFLFHGAIRPADAPRGGSVDRIATLADPAFSSNAQRLMLWGKTLELIAQHPLLGVGAGNWKVVLPSRGLSGLLSEGMESVELRPYNDWLGALAETGIPGGLCWLGIMAAALFTGFRSFRSQGHPALGFPVLLFTAALAGFAAICALGFPRERAEHMAWYAASLAALFSLAGGGREAPSPHSNVRATWPPPDPRAAGILAAICLILAGAAAWFSIGRLRSEIQIHRALEAQHAQDWPGLLAALDQVNPALANLNPASSPLAWHEGIAWYRIGDRAMAEAAFRRALRHHPWHIHALHHLAVCRAAAGDTAGAIGLLRRVMTISPAFQASAQGLARLERKAHAESPPP